MGHRRWGIHYTSYGSRLPQADIQSIFFLVLSLWDSYVGADLLDIETPYLGHTTLSSTDDLHILGQRRWTRFIIFWAFWDNVAGTSSYCIVLIWDNVGGTHYRPLWDNVGGTRMEPLGQRRWCNSWHQRTGTVEHTVYRGDGSRQSHGAAVFYSPLSLERRHGGAGAGRTAHRVNGQINQKRQ